MAEKIRQAVVVEKQILAFAGMTNKKDIPQGLKPRVGGAQNAKAKALAYLKDKSKY